MSKAWFSINSWNSKLLNFLASQWKPLFFSASVAVILEHAGILTVFVKLSWLVVSSLASQDVKEFPQIKPGSPVVVKITESDFVARYGEKSPLDRCILAEDIGRILAKSPKVLAIDFDLSPLARESESENKCQRKLDELLDRQAARIVLLTPFPAATSSLLVAKHEWMQARCKAGLHFSDGAIEVSMGTVTDMATGDTPRLKARMADQVQAGVSDLICSDVETSIKSEENRWLSKRETTDDDKDESVPINFLEAIRKVSIAPLDSSSFEHVPSLSQNAVFFGGHWGRDDEYLTPIGYQPGIVIHAARSVSLESPVHPPSPVVGVLSDIGIALCFASLIHAFWGGYVRARRFDALVEKHSGKNSGFGALLMFSFVITYFALVLFFFVVANELYSKYALMLAPALIALAMLMDGFVAGPVDTIKELLLEQHESSIHPGVDSQIENRGDLTLDEEGRILMRKPLLMCMAAGLYVGVFILFPMVTQKISGIIFYWGFRIFYVIIGLLLLNALRKRVCMVVQFPRKIQVVGAYLLYPWRSAARFMSGLKHPLALLKRTWMQVTSLPISKVGELLAHVRALAFWSALAGAAWITAGFAH